MLTTTNLKLVPLTHAQLLLYKNDGVALAENLGINYLEAQNDPSVIGEIEEATEFWIKGTLEHPEGFEWYTNWAIILLEQNVIIGGIGFAGMPDEFGKSMVGYGLDVRFHGKGYATEALGVMIQWARRQPAAKILVAETPLMNLPSHRVLEKNGFTHKETKQDTFVWELRLR